MKDQNIIDLLNKQAAYGCRIDRKISKLLLKSTNRQYSCNWKNVVRGAFTYDGNMYLGNGNCNFSHCFQGCFTKENKPHLIPTKMAEVNAVHNIGTEAGWRIRDTLLFDSNVVGDNVKGLMEGNYQQSLFALTSNSYVLRYVMKPEGWSIASNIYIGSKSFSHLNYDNHWENFVVKSKHLPDETKPDVRFYFVLFNAAPFQFKAVFAIQKSIFGLIRDAFVINGMIVILSNQFYTFYNLQELLNESQFHNCNFGDTVPSQLDMTNLGFPDGTVVGEYPYGLPLNTKIQRTPTVLFQLSSKNINGISFGGFPWYCIGTHFETSKLYSIATGKEISELQHGKYAFATLDDEKKAYFHSDRSGRILSIEYDEIKCMRIVEDGSFEPCYSLQFGQKLIQQKRPEPKRSRSGRTYKRIVSKDCISLPSEIIHAIDYDNSLDILVVLYTRIEEGRNEINKYAVTLYDNLSGIEIRTFFLETEISEHDGIDWNVFFNDLMVICTVRNVGSVKSVDVVFTYHIYENRFLPTCDF